MSTTNTNMKLIRIGEVYYMKFRGDGNEQSGWRPGLVFQNNTGNYYSPNIVALPFTTSLKKTGQPTHVIVLAAESGLPRDSMVLCENPMCVSKDRIGEYITIMPPRIMAKIAEASILSSSIISYIDAETLVTLWEKAVALNRAPDRATR